MREPVTQSDTPQPDMVVLVDAQDRQIGLCEKLEAHQKGLRHRAFSIFLFRQTKLGWQVLLQKRQLSKYHCGGLWSNACCSHPRENEDIAAAAARRLQEELSIQAPVFGFDTLLYTENCGNGLIENEYDHLLAGLFTDQDIPFNPAEVAAIRWMPVNEIIPEIDHDASQFTPWFPLAWEKLMAKWESLALQLSQLTLTETS